MHSYCFASIKPFVWWRSRCRRRRGLVKFPNMAAMTSCAYAPLANFDVLKIYLGSKAKAIKQKKWHRGISEKAISESPVPLFQSESKCETFHMKMTFICMKMKLLAELIFIWKGSHLDSFWDRGTRKLGNSLLVYQNFAGRKLTVAAGKCTLARIKKLTKTFLKTQMAHTKFLL